MIARHSSCDVRKWTPGNRLFCDVVASDERGGNKNHVSVASARLPAATLSSIPFCYRHLCNTDTVDDESLKGRGTSGELVGIETLGTAAKLRAAAA